MQPSLFDSYGGPARGGLVFAKVRAGETCFAGRVADAKKTIDPDLPEIAHWSGASSRVLDESEWKKYIERMADEFVHGRAEVDPRDYPRPASAAVFNLSAAFRNRKTVRESKGRYTEDDDAAEE